MPTQTNPKLHAHLAHLGIASRRKAEELIVEGRVFVNGTIAKVGQRIDPTKDEISVDTKIIQSPGTPQTIYTYLINKPVGIFSTTSDELGRKTVIDFLKKQLGNEFPNARLYPVGRLDADSQGLMILTNDGELTHWFTHPSKEIKKTYHIEVEGLPSSLALSHLERGVRLKEGYTAPAEIEVINLNQQQSSLNITIHEGRYHQVKRMMLRVGYPVISLTRIAMGPFKLDDLAGQSYKRVSYNNFTEIL